MERPVKTADELAQESLDTLLKDMPVAAGEEVALLINGLGATSVEELYILSNSVTQQLEDKGIKVYRTFVGRVCHLHGDGGGLHLHHEGGPGDQGDAGHACQHPLLLPEVRGAV